MFLNSFFTKNVSNDIIIKTTYYKKQMQNGEKHGRTFRTAYCRMRFLHKRRCARKLYTRIDKSRPKQTRCLYHFKRQQALLFR